MKRAFSAILIASALLFLSACGTPGSTGPGSSIPKEDKEYIVDGTETVNLRSIQNDVYVTVVKHGETLTNEDLEGILEDVKDGVGEDHFLYITTYDLDQPYEADNKTKYRESYEDISTSELFAPTGEGANSFDFKESNQNPYTGEKFPEGIKNRITIPYESLKVYYDAH